MPIHDDDDLDAVDPVPDPANDLTALDADLLDRHLAGESSASENEDVRRRFGDVRSRTLAALAASDAVTPVETSAAWRELRDRLAAEPVHRVDIGRRPRVWRPAALRIAASLVLLLGAGTIAYRVANRTRGPELAASEQVVRTGTAERRDVLLPDGTRVMLAPQSRLTYSAAFAGGQRDVRLSGEAFFSVAHDASRPFTVRAAGATARVLGTEFGVRAQAGRPAEVYVASGRVRVQPPHDTIGPVLGAGEVGRVGVGRGPVVITRGVSISEFLAWRDGRLIATARPAGEVLDELGRWFDVTFSVADRALATRSISVDLRVGSGASLEAVLDALSLTLDARYVRVGTVVTMSAR